MGNRISKASYLMPLGAGVFFGSVGIFVRTLYSCGFSNATVLFIRFLLGVIMLGIFMLIKDRNLFQVQRQNIIWIICCGIASMLVTNICFCISCTTLSLSLSAVLLSIAPVYTLIASRIVFRNRITAKKVACVLMSIAGCILVSGVIDTNIRLPFSGLAAGIVSGMSYGMYGIYSRKAIDGGAKGLTITFYCMIMMMAVLVPFTDFETLGNYVSSCPVQHGVFLVAHSLCTAVLPYLLITYSMKYMTPGIATILASGEPVAAMIFGALFFGETPTWLAILGMALTVMALGMLCVDGTDKISKQPEHG